MATSKATTKPQPRRRAKVKRKVKKTTKRKPEVKVSAKAAKAAVEDLSGTELFEQLPARRIVRRPKPDKPKFLNSRSTTVREKGFALMMSNWVEFAKVPLSYLSEQELKKLFDAEVNGRKRWNIVNRLHSAYNTKRIKRERTDLRQRCGLGG